MVLLIIYFYMIDIFISFKLYYINGTKRLVYLFLYILFYIY